MAGHTKTRAFDHTCSARVNLPDERPHITLVRATSEADEVAIASTILRQRYCRCSRTLPILDSHTLIERVSLRFSKSGWNVQITDELPGISDSKSVGTTQYIPVPPLTVIAVNISPAFYQLAAVCCEESPYVFDARDQMVFPGGSHHVLILMGDSRCDMRMVVAHLCRSGMEISQLGVLFLFDPHDARYFLLTLWAGRTIRLRPYFSLLSSTYGTVSSFGTHPKGRLRTLEAEALLSRQQGMLLVSGHSAAADLNIGSDLTLCARSDMEPSSQYVSSVLPCFNDGRCCRRNLPGHDPLSRVGLLPISTVDTDALVLSGCNSIDLYPDTLSLNHTLGYQALRSGAGAVAGTISLTLSNLELDLLFVCLLAEGLSIGEAVQEINVARPGMDRTTSGDDVVGPFVVMGDPRTRCLPVLLQQVSTCSSSKEEFNITLSSIDLDSNGMAFLRMTVPLRPRAAYISARYEGTGQVSIRGVCRAGVYEDLLYLWLAFEPGHVLSRTDVLNVSVTADSPSHGWALAMECFIHQARFWSVFLTNCEITLTQHKISASPLQGVTERVTILSRKCLSSIVLIHEQARRRLLVRDEQSAIDRCQTELVRTNRSLLECAAYRCLSLGSIMLHEWFAYASSECSDGEESSCLCHKGRATSRTYSLGGEHRAVLQCPVCGPAEESDGRGVVNVLDAPCAIVRGHEATVVCEIKSPKEENVVIDAMLVLDTWNGPSKLRGPVTACVVPAASTRTFSMVIAVPNELTPGRYPLVVLSVANGALYLRRMLVNVEQ